MGCEFGGFPPHVSNRQWFASGFISRVQWTFAYSIVTPRTFAGGKAKKRWWARVRRGSRVTCGLPLEQTAEVSDWCFRSAALWAVIPSAATLWRWHLKRYVLLAGCPPCIFCTRNRRHRLPCALAVPSVWLLGSLAERPTFFSRMLLERISMSYFIHPSHCSFCGIAVLCLLCSGTVRASVHAIDLAIIRRTVNKGRE